MLRRGRTSKERVSAKRFWKDGLGTQNIAQISLKHGRTEEQIRQYDALALEDHSYEDTLGERRRWGKNWHTIALMKKENKVQRGNALIFVEAKQAHRVNKTKNTRKVPAKELIPSIQHTKQNKIIDNNSKDQRSTTVRFTLELDGHIIPQQVRLHPRNGSSTMIWSRIKVGITGDLQPGLNSNSLRSKSEAQGRLCCKKWFRQPFFLVRVVVFSLASNFQFPGNRRVVSTVTLLTQHVPSTASSTLTLIPGLQRLLTSRIPCADPREPQHFMVTDLLIQNLAQVAEPNRIVDNQITNEQEDITCTEDNQITEIEGHVKTLSCNQSLLSSTQDSTWKHCYASRSRLGRRTNSCSAGFTTVLTDGARSKYGKIASLSLWKRRLDVQFVSRSELHRNRETCCIVFKVESRHVFRERATCWCFRE